MTRSELSPRQKEITDLVIAGHANKEIAYRLGLTEGTIKMYLIALFQKVGAKNRTALAMWHFHAAE